MRKSEIKNQFKVFMKYRNYAKSTSDQYYSALCKFLDSINDTPENISTKEIIEYLSKINSVSKQKQMTGTLRILYRDVLKCKIKFKGVKYPKKEHKIPKVLSRDQAIEIVNKPKNLKHKAMLYLLFDTGIRRSELLNLRVNDINGDRKTIHIRQGKGAKDRNVPIDSSTLELLREYYRSFKPNNYLFEGTKGKYSASSLLKVVKKYSSHINFNVTPHTFRHTFATLLVERGENYRKIQLLMGHSSIKTIEQYTGMAKVDIISLLAA